MSELVIETENLSKDYVLGPQTIHALADLNLKVRHGEFVAIMGPSGSGKSTLMNLLGCLDTPTSGRYLCDGIDTSTLSPDELAKALDIDARHAEFIYSDIANKRKTTRYMHLGAVLVEDVAEISK